MKKFDFDVIILFIAGILASTAIFLGVTTMFKRSFAKTSNIDSIDSTSTLKKAEQLQTETARELKQQKRENEQKMRDYRNQQRIQQQRLRDLQRRY